MILPRRVFPSSGLQISRSCRRVIPPAHETVASSKGLLQNGVKLFKDVLTVRKTWQLTHEGAVARHALCGESSRTHLLLHARWTRSVECARLRQFRIPVIASRIKKDFESAHVSSTVSMTVNMEEKMKTSKRSLGIGGSDFLGPMELSSART